jgi:hypothetical protein
MYGMNQEPRTGFLDANHKELAENVQKYHEKKTFWAANVALSNQIKERHGLAELACAQWDLDGKANDPVGAEQSSSPDCIHYFDALQLVKFNEADADILKKDFSTSIFISANTISKLSLNARATLAAWSQKSMHEIKEKGAQLPTMRVRALREVLEKGYANSVPVIQMPIVKKKPTMNVRIVPYDEEKHGNQVRAIDKANNDEGLYEYRNHPSRNVAYTGEDTQHVIVSADNKTVIGVIRSHNDANGFDATGKPRTEAEYLNEKSNNICRISAIVIDKEYQDQGYDRYAMDLFFNEMSHRWIERVEIGAHPQPSFQSLEDKSTQPTPESYKDLGFTCVSDQCKTAFKAITYSEEKNLKGWEDAYKGQKEEEKEKAQRELDEKQKKANEVKRFIYQKGIQNLYVNSNDPDNITLGSDEIDQQYKGELFYSWPAEHYMKAHAARQQVADQDRFLDRKLSKYIEQEKSIDPKETGVQPPFSKNNWNGAQTQLSKNNCEDMPRELIDKLDEAKLVAPKYGKKAIRPMECDILVHLEEWGNIQRNPHLRPKRRPETPVTPVTVAHGDVVAVEYPKAPEKTARAVFTRRTNNQNNESSEVPEWLLRSIL